MDINLLLKGLGVGLVVAIPIGPAGLLVTQRILTRGKMHELVSGLGAPTADVIYSSSVAFGLTFGGILITLGIAMITNTPV